MAPPRKKAYVVPYTPGPVATKFHADVFSRVKLLIGPFACLSCDTEYLTPAGWKRFDEYALGDEVAEFSLETGAIEFHTPAYIKQPCSQFYHFKNEYGIDHFFSGGHTVLYRTRFKPEEWRTIKAEELARKHNTLKDGFSGRFPTVFKSPNSDGVNLSDSELRLMVAISADGSFPRAASTDRCILTVRKDRKKERLRWLLADAGIKWEERVSDSRPTEVRFAFNAPARNKELWRYFNCSNYQMGIITEEFTFWDGHVDERGGKIFSSTVKKNADFIQYVLATQGIRSVVVDVNHGNPKWKKVYRVYGNTGTTDLSLRQAPKIETVASTDGYQYCFNTSTGFFPIRRNGKIIITGNTGKSTSASFDEVIYQPKRIKPAKDGIRYSKFAVVRNTIPMLKDTTIKTFLHWFPPAVFGVYKETQRNYLIKIEDMEIELVFRGLDEEKDVRNLLSLDLTGAWIEETREINNSVFKGVLGRTKRYPSHDIYDKTDPRYYLKPGEWVQWERRKWEGFEPEKYMHLIERNCLTCAKPFVRELGHKCPLAVGTVLARHLGVDCAEFVSKFSPYITPPQVMLTTNYPSREHWLYRDFVGNPIEGYAIYEQDQSENARNLDADYYINLEKDYADRPDLLQTLVRGDWGVTVRGRQVYPEFDRRVHVSISPLLPERKRQILVGWDNTGISPAISLSYINEIGQWCVFKEFCFSQISIADATEVMIIWTDANLPDGCTYRNIGDPAGKNRGANMKSAADYISGKGRDYGRDIKIEDGIQTFKIRRESVAGRLGHVDIDDKGEIIGKKPKMINDDAPAMLIDPSCIRIIDGMEGGYAFPEIGSSGVFGTEPKKPNSYTDIQDSLQYVATIMFPVKKARRVLDSGINKPRGTWRGTCGE